MGLKKSEVKKPKILPPAIMFVISSVIFFFFAKLVRQSKDQMDGLVFAFLFALTLFFLVEILERIFWKIKTEKNGTKTTTFYLGWTKKLVMVEKPGNSPFYIETDFFSTRAYIDPKEFFESDRYKEIRERLKNLK